MANAKLPPDVHIQHDTPAIFYCWKYWMQTGEFHQGCTDVKASPENFLDLNDYGWVYIVIPVAVLFLLVFIFYCCCRGKSHKSKPTPLLSEDSDSEDGEVFRPRGKSSAPYRGVPVRNSDARNYYTVVPIDPNDPQKVPVQGGIDPSHPGYIPQQRLYPRLTAMKQKAGINGTNMRVAAESGQGESKEIRPNDYRPQATLKDREQEKRNTHGEHLQSSSDDSSDEQ